MSAEASWKSREGTLSQQLESAAAYFNVIERSWREIFGTHGRLQECLDEIEDGSWQGRKVAAWNGWILPCAKADEETLTTLRKTYQAWFHLYDELTDGVAELHKFYLQVYQTKEAELEPTELARACLRRDRAGALRYHLTTRGMDRLVQLSITVTTGIPFCAWGNRNQIRCLHLPR